MLQKQHSYLEYLDKLQHAFQDSKVPAPALAVLQEDVASAELLIPVIGAFSAGKSSLLNAFLQRDVLPVGIKPETELATELRYGEDERIDAVGKDGSLGRYAVDDFETVKQDAARLSMLRVFLNNENLRNVAPLVVVDMPGFDSAALNHNQAISHYLGRGAHYLAVTSVEDGNVTRTMERQLLDVHETGRELSFVLSKTNLRSNGEVADVAARVSAQAEQIVGHAQVVLQVDRGAGQLEQLLARIDPERLFGELFQDRLKRHHYGLLDNVNIGLAAVRNSSAENAQVLAEMNTGLEKLARKRDTLLQELRSRYADVGVDSTLDAVGRALSGASEELVTAAESGDADALSRSVADIVRAALLRKIKAQMTEIGGQMVHEFALELSGVDQVMAGYLKQDGWAGKLSDDIQRGMEKAQKSLADVSRQLDKASQWAKLFKSLATILAVTTNVVMPLVELVIIFLPDLLPALMGGNRREKIREAIMTEMIPSVKRELRGKLPQIFEEQLATLVVHVSGEFERAISEKQAAITLHEQGKQADVDAIALDIAAFETLRAQLNTLARDYLFTVEEV